MIENNKFMPGDLVFSRNGILMGIYLSKDGLRYASKDTVVLIPNPANAVYLFNRGVIGTFTHEDTIEKAYESFCRSYIQRVNINEH